MKRTGESRGGRARRAEVVPGGARVFQRIYTRLGCRGRPPQFVAEFFPYANLTHTIRLEEHTARVRLSDVLRRAPLPVLEAVAAILLARLYRRRLPREFAQVYRQFSLSRRTRRRLHLVRRRRGRRVKNGPRGRYHNLGPLFTQLNERYFSGRLRRPRLGWSARAWRTQLGCFDPALDQIVLSSRLDREDVPRSVVEYVLYHEMLHVKHPIARMRCGLQAHSLQFREEEKRFRSYAQARRILALRG